MEIIEKAIDAEDYHANRYLKTRQYKDVAGRIVEEVAGYGDNIATHVHYEYDGAGNKTAVTDGNGNRTDYIYDDLNRLVRVVLPEAAVWNPETKTSQLKRAEIKYEYDANGNKVKEVAPTGHIVRFVYDELGRKIKTEWCYTDPSGTEHTVANKTFYDAAGNKVKVVDPLGKIAQFGYSAQGWLLWQKDTIGNVTSFTYDKVGNKLSATDPRGNATPNILNDYTIFYQYDDLYRITTGILPDETPEDLTDNPRISYTYDLDGNVLTEKQANGNTIHYTYTPRHWVDSQTVSLNGNNYKTTTQYDLVGNKIAVTDPSGNTTQFDYDVLNRLTTVFHPEGNFEAFAYDKNGNRTMVSDGRTNTTKTFYDALNRVIAITDALGNKTEYRYDIGSRRIGTLTPNGLLTVNQYNKVGWLMESKDPSGRVMKFDYDAAGNMVYSKDRRGTESLLTYNDLYQLENKSLTNGAQSQSVTFTYNTIGNLESISDNRITLGYDYDIFGRVKRTDQIHGSAGTTYSTNYRYDVMGNMTGIKYPGNSDWYAYNYDILGRLVSVPGFAGTVTTPGFTYDSGSRLSEVRSNNGVTTSFTFDKNGRMTGIRAAEPNSGNAFMDFGYTYDRANNIELRTNRITNKTNTYIYDQLNRMKSAKVAGDFEGEIPRDALNMNLLEKDILGQKQPLGTDVEISEEAIVMLDYASQSIVVDLWSETPNLSRILLTPAQPMHRVTPRNIKLFIK